MMDLHSKGTCDGKHLQLINKLMDTLTEDKRIDTGEIENFKKFNIINIMRIKINNYIAKYQNLTRSIRIYVASIKKVYQQHKYFLNKFTSFFDEFSYQPTADFIRNIESYCKQPAPSYQTPMKNWIIKPNPSTPKVVTHFKAPLFGNEITRLQLIKAVETASNSHMDDLLNPTGNSDAITFNHPDNASKVDHPIITVDHPAKNSNNVTDEQSKNGLDNISDDDSGFLKSDLEDISDDDEFFDGLENPKKKLKRSS